MIICLGGIPQKLPDGKVRIKVLTLQGDRYWKTNMLSFEEAQRLCAREAFLNLGMKDFKIVGYNKSEDIIEKEHRTSV